MKETFVWTLLIVLAGMAGLGLLRVPFARRFWITARRAGYIYVALIVVLAAVSIVFGVRL